MRAIIQARMSSTRCPGKVLRGDRPILGEMVRRLRLCSLVSGIMIATSTDGTDDAIADWCLREHVECYRGPLEDVAKRYLGAAVRELAFVRLCGDSPFIDPYTVDKAIRLYCEEVRPPVLVSNVPNRGNSVEVVNWLALFEAYPDMKPEEREHVTLHFYRNPCRGSILKFNGPAVVGAFTVDTEDDWQRYAAVLSA